MKYQKLLTREIKAAVAEMFHDIIAKHKVSLEIIHQPLGVGIRMSIYGVNEKILSTSVFYSNREIDGLGGVHAMVIAEYLYEEFKCKMAEDNLHVDEIIIGEL